MRKLPTWSEKIRLLRKEAGLTISQLAELSDMDGGFLNYIENGKKSPSLNTLYKLSKGLNVPMAQFFSEKTPSNGDDKDLKLSSQIRSVLHGKTEKQKEMFLTILKTLKTPATFKAIHQILKH